eukprot:82045-Rhodomonas_salina.6
MLLDVGSAGSAPELVDEAMAGTEEALGHEGELLAEERRVFRRSDEAIANVAVDPRRSRRPHVAVVMHLACGVNTARSGTHLVLWVKNAGSAVLDMIMLALGICRFSEKGRQNAELTWMGAGRSAMTSWR